MKLKDFFQLAWQNYVEITPLAQEIEKLLMTKGEVLVNDHIALRTFESSKVGLEKISENLRTLGYQIKGHYVFTEKKLKAVHFEHSEGWPKIFVSELQTRSFSPSVQMIFSDVEDYLRPFESPVEVISLKRPWPALLDSYERLLEESEYAAWLYAIGFRPNHFTVSVNALKSFAALEELNQFLIDSDFKMNASGGIIKGSQEQGLKQSSTLADCQEISFSDGKKTIPTCYYEFAQRFNDTNGKLFSGFLEKSADAIFESTDVRANK